jgi:hypothetical protein
LETPTRTWHEVPARNSRIIAQEGFDSSSIVMGIDLELGKEPHASRNIHQPTHAFGDEILGSELKQPVISEGPTDSSEGNTSWNWPYIPPEELGFSKPSEGYRVESDCAYD